MSNQLDQKCLPNGAPFDREGNPRQRYVRVELDGSYCIVQPHEADAVIGDDDRSAYKVSDVWYSPQELAALPEFTGF